MGTFKNKKMRLTPKSKKHLEKIIDNNDDKKQHIAFKNYTKEKTKMLL